MSDISNRTLIVTLLAAIILLGAGISVNIYKLTQLREGLTGAATTSDRGQTNISIAASTSITNRVTSIDFGSGFADGSDCVMDSYGRHNFTGAFCSNFYNVTNGFYLENTGNLNISVNFSCNGNCTANELIGGTNPRFKIRVNGAFTRNQTAQTNDTANSCLGYTEGTTNTKYFGGWNITNRSNPTRPEGVEVELNFTNMNMTLCGNTSHFPLDFQNGRDAGVVDINVTVPTDALPKPGVNSSATFTFNAISAG